MLSTLAIAFSMSADAFAAALGKGAALRRPHLREALRTGLIFGAIETITPILGWTFGLAASQLVADVDHWIAFGLLGAVGAKMLWEGLFRAAERERPARHSFALLAATALGTSVDALAVGATLAFLGVEIWTVALAIGATTFGLATLGIMIGHAAGARVGRVAEAVGGVVLIGIGTGILTQHLGLVSFA